MNIDHAFFHQVTLNILYACIVVLVFVMIERLVYYAMLTIRGWRIQSELRRSSLSAAAIPNFSGKDVISASLAEYVAVQQQSDISRNRIEDLSSALFLRVNGRINARLWLLDTIVTAAPLLGLIGTILGIMDTFNALSSGGISDPAAVSRGIASALAATAIGIGTALFGLLAYNLLHRQAEVITENFKGLLLTTTR